MAKWNPTELTEDERESLEGTTEHTHGRYLAIKTSLEPLTGVMLGMFKGNALDAGIAALAISKLTMRAAQEFNLKAIKKWGPASVIFDDMAQMLADQMWDAGLITIEKEDLC